MTPTKTGLLVTTFVVTFAILASRAAKATQYIISSSATDDMAGSGQLGPGTLSGSFDYDPATNAFSSVSLDIEGVQSTNVNGLYTLGTYATSNGTNLYLTGITPNNSGGQSNEDTFLDVRFVAALGNTGDEVTSIEGVNGGNHADFTTPPTDAFADPVPAPVATPEPSSLAILGAAICLFGLRRWAGSGSGLA